MDMCVRACVRACVHREVNITLTQVQRKHVVTKLYHIRQLLPSNHQNTFPYENRGTQTWLLYINIRRNIRLLPSLCSPLRSPRAVTLPRDVFATKRAPRDCVSRSLLSS